MRTGLVWMVSLLIFAAAGHALPMKTAEFGTVPGRTTRPAHTEIYLEYYNFCSGYVWVWSDWTPGAKIGVCFDLREECAMTCTLCRDLVVGWWALKPVTPWGRVDFEVFCTEGGCCPCVEPLAGVYDMPITSTWTAIDWTGLSLDDCEDAGCDRCQLIYMCTIDTPQDTHVYSDGDDLNWTYGCGTRWTCSPHSFVYVNTYDYCAEFGAPAALFSEDMRSFCPPYQGDVGFFHNWIADFTFNCWAPPSGAEQASWSQIKSLYR